MTLSLKGDVPKLIKFSLSSKNTIEKIVVEISKPCRKSFGDIFFIITRAISKQLMKVKIKECEPPKFFDRIVEVKKSKTNIPNKIVVFCLSLKSSFLMNIV